MAVDIDEQHGQSQAARGCSWRVGARPLRPRAQRPGQRKGRCRSAVGLYLFGLSSYGITNMDAVFYQ
jgi:hypothetical protein